ncbi:putative transcriptional regulator [Dyella sp. SG562]|uniref:helix-turn-helix domain-containing protein n=1 Tax=Dyella sp. SG562 TaxID=2587017 RepID=UPI0014209F77|nr:helix-turn-helix domain-containing protein [Dyella sp. SG562]NII73236.1 putative transcriptional regulator [Dyella sp. SG562]
MTPLRDRIPAALALQPMTVDQLALCLASTRNSVSRVIHALRDGGVIRRTGSVSTKGKAWPQYSLQMMRDIAAGKTTRRIR